MAGVNVGGASAGGRRSLDSEINMIPMIDLLMVTISFLLITAVWVQAARMDADAQVPGPPSTPPCETTNDCKDEPRLHVDAADSSKFVLTWKRGREVLKQTEVSREVSHVAGAKGKGPSVSFPALAAKVKDEWKESGTHRDILDKRFDRAVVHTGNDMRYAELVAVMDAVASPKRVVRSGPNDKAMQEASAFAVTFATD